MHTTPPAVLDEELFTAHTYSLGKEGAAEYHQLEHLEVNLATSGTSLYLHG